MINILKLDIPVTIINYNINIHNLFEFIHDLNL